MTVTTRVYAVATRIIQKARSLKDTEPWVLYPLKFYEYVSNTNYNGLPFFKIVFAAISAGLLRAPRGRCIFQDQSQKRSYGGKDLPSSNSHFQPHSLFSSLVSILLKGKPQILWTKNLCRTSSRNINFTLLCHFTSLPLAHGPLLGILPHQQSAEFATCRSFWASLLTSMALCHWKVFWRGSWQYSGSPDLKGKNA